MPQLHSIVPAIALLFAACNPLTEPGDASTPSADYPEPDAVASGVAGSGVVEVRVVGGPILLRRELDSALSPPADLRAESSGIRTISATTRDGEEYCVAE